MFRHFVCLLIVFATAEGCAYTNRKGLIPNRFQSLPYTGFNPGAKDSSDAPGDKEEVVFTDNFELFGLTFKNIGIYDNGFVNTFTGAYVNTYGTTTPAAAPGAAAFDYIAVFWAPQSAADKMEYSYKQIYKADQYNAGGTAKVGAEICTLERVHEDYREWEDSPVKQMLQVTWKYEKSDGTVEALFQLALALTDSGKTFVIMYYDSTTAGYDTTYSGVSDIIFGQIEDNDGLSDNVAGICQDTNILAEVQSRSNSYCGKPGQFVFATSSGTATTGDMATCSSLNPDKNQRSSQIRETLIPHSTCFARGYCNYTLDTSDLVEIEFWFFKTDVVYDDFALTDSSGSLQQQSCLLAGASVTDETAYWKVTKTYGSSTDITNCGGTYNAGTGEMNIYIWNYNDTDGILYITHKTNLFHIKCYPGDFKFTFSDAFTVGDISATTVPMVTPSITLTGVSQIATSGQTSFTAADQVYIGTPFYMKGCYNRGPNFNENVLPYGIYAKDCYVSDTSDFSGTNVLQIIANGCPASDQASLRPEVGFYAAESTVSSAPFCILAGSIRAARWQTSATLYMKCTFGTCKYKAGFSGSKCENSCTGTHVDLAKRDVESSELKTVTAHFNIIDKKEGERTSADCTDRTLALTTIAVMIFLLLVAMAITAVLLAKMRFRKNK